jgi:hypothetical protein
MGHRQKQLLATIEGWRQPEDLNFEKTGLNVSIIVLNTLGGLI